MKDKNDKDEPVLKSNLNLDENTTTNIDEHRLLVSDAMDDKIEADNVKEKDKKSYLDVIMYTYTINTSE